MLCFDGNTLTVTVWALRAKTPTPTVRPWLGRVAGVSVRRMRTRWRAYTRFTYVTDSTTEDLLMRNRGSLSLARHYDGLLEECGVGAENRS